MRTSAVVVLLPSILAVATGFSLRQGETWLRDHPNPQDDDLEELKNTNPSAYGLVKALLMKRSLGLLDPKHPTASFAATPAPASSEESGPDAFAKFASVGGQHADTAAPDYPEAPAPQHRGTDWLNWRPQESASSEDAEVQNVLGAVAQMASPSKSLLSRNRDSDAAPKQASATVEEAPASKAKAAAPIAQENSYLKDVDFGIKKPVPAPKVAPEENSYLKGLDLGGDAAEQQPNAKPHENLLASFSWDDAKSSNNDNRVTSSLATKRRVVAHEAATSDASDAQGASKSAQSADPLSAWLENKAPVAHPKVALAAAATVTEAPHNSYLADLA